MLEDGFRRPTPWSCGNPVRHLSAVRSELVCTWHLPPLPLLPGGPREQRAWGGEAMCNMPVAVLAGTSLLAQRLFHAFSCLCSNLQGQELQLGSVAGVQRVFLKHHLFLKRLRKQTPTARASLSQIGVQPSSSATPLLACPRHFWDLPKTPTACNVCRQLA